MQQVCSICILYAASMQHVWIVCSKYATYVYRMQQVGNICTYIICNYAWSMEHMYNYMREAYAASMQQMYMLYLYTDSIFSKYATYVYLYAGYFKPIWSPLPNAHARWIHAWESRCTVACSIHDYQLKKNIFHFYPLYIKYLRYFPKIKQRTMYIIYLLSTCIYAAS